MPRQFLAAILATSLLVTTVHAVEAPVQKPEPAPISPEQRLADLERQVEALLKEVRQLGQAIATVPRVEVIELKKVEAATVAKELGPLFGNRGGEAIADPRTNSLVLHGTESQISQAKAVIEKIEK